MLGDAGHFGVFLDDALDGAGGKTAIIAGGVDGLEVAAIVEKKRVEGISASREVVADAVGGGFGDENGSVFVAFTADDELAAVEVDGIAIELDELGDAKTTGEEKLDDGAVAKAGLGGSVDLVEEVFDFVVLKKSDLLADDVGELDEGGVERFDVAFGEVFEEAAEGDEVVGLGDGFEVFAVAIFFTIELKAEFAKELLGDVGRLEFIAFAGDVARNEEETIEVAFVIFGSFAGTAFFYFETFDKVAN